MTHDLTKQLFPEDEATPDLIYSVNIPTLNKWIADHGSKWEIMLY
jgi:hypothetical protein